MDRSLNSTRIGAYSANKVIGSLKSLSEMDETDRGLSLIFKKKEAVESSKIENTYSTIEEVLGAESKSAGLDDFSKKFPNKVNKRESIVDRTAAESARYYAYAVANIIDQIESKGFSYFNKTELNKIHEEVVSRDPAFSGTPGANRTVTGSYVWIGGGPEVSKSTYNPPIPARVDKLLDNFMKWFTDRDILELGDAGLGMSLPVRMAIAHIHFEAIHPFSDGNGRVGRALFPIQMAMSNLMPVYISGFINKYKADYFEALKQGQQRLNLIPMIRFLGEALKESNEFYIESRMQIESLQSEWKDQFRKGSTQRKIIALLGAYPLFSSNQMKELVSVADTTFHRAINDLLTRGIVEERTGYKRNRVFVQKKILDLLSRGIGDQANI